MHKNDGFYERSLETKIDFPILKKAYEQCSYHIKNPYLFHEKIMCIEVKVTVLGKKHMLHAHKGSCCDIGNMILGVRTESIKLTFLEILIS